MIPLSTAGSSGFTFKPNFRGFELKQNELVVGTLKRPSFWCSTSIAATTRASWSMRQSGFWGTSTEIVDSETQQRIATFTSDYGGKGTLTFADGQKFLLWKEGCFRPVWMLASGSQPVLQIRQRARIVDISQKIGVPSERLAMLALFGLYRIRQADEAAGAVVAAMAAV